MEQKDLRKEPPAIPVQLAREIARQGEERLKALMHLGTAADLRATTLIGIFGAAAVAIGAAVLANLGSGHLPGPLVFAGIVTCLLLFAAAFMAAWAGAPCDFFIPGGNPEILRDWSWEEGAWRTEVEALDATAQRYEKSISDDQKILERSSRWVKRALWTAFAAPILGDCFSLP
jgi:hypothetical protein